MRATVPLLIVLALAACSKAPPPAAIPHQIHIAGASAALPFSFAAAERLMREQSDAIAPLVQADGSGHGIARFCAGLGALHPDLVATIRPMTPAERADCAAHGVAHIAEIPFGWSATVLVTRPDTPALSLSRRGIAAALTGRASDWHQIDASLPALPIALFGPPPRRDIADGLFDLAPTIRTDGAYHGRGADAALIVRQIVEKPGTIGIVPYAYAVQAGDTLRMIPIDGVAPSPDMIASGRYPWRLPLILYAKAGEAPAVPGLPALIGFYRDGWADHGAFHVLGLVPLDAVGRAGANARAGALIKP